MRSKVSYARVPASGIGSNAHEYSFCGSKVLTEPRVRRPIVLLGAPRSGTTMLFNAMSSHPALWSLYRESGPLIERYFPVSMTPGSSDVVEAADVDDQVASDLRRAFLQSVGNMGSSHLLISGGVSAFLRTPLGRRVMAIPGISRLRLATIFSRFRSARRMHEVRIVEKTPENCFRVQLLKRVFPDALFIYIVRDPRQSISSIHTGWVKSTEFRRFQFPATFDLRNFEARWWSFGLLPEWQRLNGASVMEVCARQWVLYNQYCRRDLPLSDTDRTLKVSYEEMVAHAPEVLHRVAEWADLDPAPFKRFSRSLPIVNTFTNPRDNKWRSLESELADVVTVVGEEAAQLGYEF